MRFEWIVKKECFSLWVKIYILSNLFVVWVKDTSTLEYTNWYGSVSETLYISIKNFHSNIGYFIVSHAVAPIRGQDHNLDFATNCPECGKNFSREKLLSEVSQLIVKKLTLHFVHSPS